MKKNIFNYLESRMVQYKQLITVPIKETHEIFVEIDKKIIPFKYDPKMSDMKATIGNKMYVRKSVYERLKKAQKILKKSNPDMSLLLTYGYRTLAIQKKRFLIEMKNIDNFFPNPDDLYEEIHRYIAVPTVAGHPTGGAVDIIIIDTQTGKIIDFGSEQYNYQTKNCYVFSSDIPFHAKKNRLLLRSVMLHAGFAPFNGEWWHFSYGDQEWAYYYKKQYALYKQKKTIYEK